MTKLYEIADELERAMFMVVDRETGEISEDGERLLNELEMKFEIKALNVAKYIKGELAEAEAISVAAKRNLARADQHVRRAEWLGKYLTENLVKQGMDVKDPKKAGSEKILKDLDVTISFSKSASAIPTNEPADPKDWPENTPGRYIEKVPASRKLMKGNIRADLLKGKAVSGWKLFWKKQLKIK